nr:MAG TPA: hypothetical protein [Caudoviricetes sp.]
MYLICQRAAFIAKGVGCLVVRHSSKVGCGIGDYVGFYRGAEEESDLLILP